MSASGDELTRQYEREAFARYVRPIAFLLDDPKVTDIMLNAPDHPDEPGRVWVDRVGEGLRESEVTLIAVEAERLIREMAKQAGFRGALNADNPVISFQAARGQYRIEALVPPATLAPTFTLRKYVKREVRISHYVTDGMLSGAQAVALDSAASEGLTILVAGETGSGKTTLANALLHTAAGCKERRIIVIEDTSELDCPAGPSTKIAVNPKSSFGYREAIESSLRQRPNMLVLGELRKPDDAVEALRAWTTGHQGLATLHAASMDGALWMLYNLCRQSTYGRHTTKRAIADAVNVVVHIRRERGRRLIEVGRVGIGRHGFTTERVV